SICFRPAAPVSWGRGAVGSAVLTGACEGAAIHSKAMPATQASPRFILFMRMGFLLRKMRGKIFPDVLRFGLRACLEVTRSCPSYLIWRSYGFAGSMAC